MVTLNITLLIELGLFLLFLWGTARFILRPVLRSLDERQTTLDAHQADAKRGEQEATALEAQYQEGLSDARGRADDAFQDARRETLKGHNDAVKNARVWADQTVAEAREKATAAAESQRETLLKSTPEIEQRIAKRLHPNGSQS